MKFINIFVAIVIIFIVSIWFSLRHPYSEICIQTKILANDKITGNSVKLIQCNKGFTIDKFNSKTTISQVTTGYIILDENENIVSTIQAEKYNNGYFLSGIKKISYLKDEGLLFLQKETSNTEIYKFNDNKIEKIKDILSGVGKLFAFENNEFYYTDNSYNFIKKENISTGKISTIIDLSNLKRNKIHKQLYDIKVLKDNNNDLLMSFELMNPDDKSEYYSVNLNSGVIKKINQGLKGVSAYHLPISSDYSYIDGTASKYNLSYMPNSEMGVYYILKMIKKDNSLEIPRTYGGRILFK